MNVHAHARLIDLTLGRVKWDFPRIFNGCIPIFGNSPARYATLTSTRLLSMANIRLAVGKNYHRQPLHIASSFEKAPYRKNCGTGGLRTPFTRC